MSSGFDIADVSCPCGGNCVPTERDGVYYFEPCGRQISCELPWCGESLLNLRSDARVCSGAHRAKLSRWRRLKAGEAVDGYTDAEAYESRQRRTELGSRGGLRAAARARAEEPDGE